MNLRWKRSKKTKIKPWPVGECAGAINYRFG
jgi:hypothetical protein